MQTIILTLHVLIGISLIILVLLQQGKGATLGAAFGSGSSNTMFGSVGAAPFLMKLSIICAILFAVTSIGLTRLASYEQHRLNIFPSVSKPQSVSQPKTLLPPSSVADKKPAPLHHP
jgi:preprotein translocase subunit SecG